MAVAPMLVLGDVPEEVLDDEDPLFIPEEIMKEVAVAMKEGEAHEIIRLRRFPPFGFLLEPNQKALDLLSSQADEQDPYWAVSCLGGTGAGKSFLITKLLHVLGYTGYLPYSIDFSETEVGDIPVSVTGNISCYAAGSKLLFDVEGTDGTLPLMQRIIMGIGARLRLTSSEKRNQIARKKAVEQFFPPIAFTISNTVIYITREPLKNSSTSEAIKEFAASIGASSTSVRPCLVIVHNLCPLNQLRRGAESEAALVKEFLLAHDESNWLSDTFQGIWCMTFPDFNAYDKKRKIDGEEVFNEQMERLCDLLSQQYDENKLVRRNLHCALPPRSLLTIIPEIVDQVNAGKPVSIPDILRNNLKNNPDEDCQVLKGMWQVLGGFYPDRVLYGATLKSILSFCFGISAHYLAWKIAAQKKAGFPDDWFAQQAASLHIKLMDHFNMVFATCLSTSPHTYEDVEGPVKCNARLLGHDCHISKNRVIPTRFNWFRKYISMKLFGGIRDRWEGQFEFDPVLKDAAEGWGKEIMQQETLAAANLLKVGTDMKETDYQMKFRLHNAKHLGRHCEVLEVSPKVAKRAQEQGQRLGRPFCCVCFQLVVGQMHDLFVCNECSKLCDSNMRLRNGYPSQWYRRLSSETDGDLEIHFLTDESELQLFKQLLRVTQPQELGKGRDAEPGLEAYSRLEVKYVWRVEHVDLWRKYCHGRHQVLRDLQELKAKVSGERTVLSTKLHEITETLVQPDTQGAEVFLLHGTKPNIVLPIINRGMNERLTCNAAFGSGVYLCEDPEKMDQYCRPASKAQAQELKRTLLSKAPHVQDLEGLCFCFAVRAACGHPVYTRGLDQETVNSVNDCDTGKAVFSNGARRELAQIPGTDPTQPIHYHSLVVQTGKALKRFREIVVTNDNRIYAEYLIAYQRV